MKRLVLHLLLAPAKALYWVFKQLPQKNQITLITRRSTTTSEDFRYLTNRIMQRPEGSTVVVLNHQFTSLFSYPFQVLKEMWHIARSSAVIVDSYIPVVSLFRHAPGLPIVQMWHAIGAIKQFGYQSLDREEGSAAGTADLLRMHKNYSTVVASSPRTAELFAAGFGVPKDQVSVTGAPRIDYLQDTSVWERNNTEITESLRLDLKKPVLLYLPTFRKGKPIPVKELADAVDLAQWQIVYSPHPLDTHPVDGFHDSVIVAEGYEAQQLLAIADTVITDYSAVAYESVLCNLPTLFWWYDKDLYQHSRGLNVSAKTLKASGVLAESIHELVEKLDHIASGNKPHYLPDFVTEFGVTTENAIDTLLDNIYHSISNADIDRTDHEDSQ